MNMKAAGCTVLAALMMATCLATGCTSSATQPTAATQESHPETRTVTDSSGNQVAIPYEVTKAAPAIGAFAQVTEMLSKGKVAAAPVKQISDYFKQVCADYVESNPDNYDTSSVESLIASGAQVVYGPSSVYSDEQRAQLENAGVAYVELSNVKTVEGMCESIETIGEILGAEEAQVAKEFTAYYRQGMTDAQQRTAGLAESQKLSVLELGYSGGAYTTVNSTDICNEYLVAASLNNAAANYTAASSSTALTVDAEQIAAWNPDLIICTSQEAAEAVKAEPALANVPAVASGNVQVIPTGIYLWSVRSGEGALMTPWLGTVAYPQLFADVDMSSLVKSFFATYYGYDAMTDAEVAKVLAGGSTASAPR